MKRHRSWFKLSLRRSQLKPEPALASTLWQPNRVKVALILNRWRDAMPLPRRTCDRLDRRLDALR